MDAFFAAVEQLEHPNWRGKPVIVGADPKEGKGRGVVSTASYEARKFGVRSAMPISRAYRLCPQGIYVPPNGKLYAHYSRMIFDILASFTPKIEILSIDEAFLDLTGSRHLYGSVKEMGQKIKQAIFEQTGLTASIGIAPCKSLAKIASDLEKPDGLTIVRPENVHAFLDPLPITRLWGVGKKTYQILHEMGIESIGQLKRFPREILEAKFGKFSEHLYRLARGVDDREVSPYESMKSVGHETTFETDVTDLEILKDTLLWLSEKVAGRLRRYKFRGKTIQLKIRFEDFTTYTRDKTLKDYTALTEDIYSVGLHLFKEFQPLPRPVRLIGISVANLSDEKGLQLSLWDVENARKFKLEKIMDELQEKFGKTALTHAQTLTIRSKKNSPNS